MSTTPDWHVHQAAILRSRAEACRQLADRLDAASLHQLPDYSGELTWRCPVADDFDLQVAAHRRRLDEAVEGLHVNACGLSGDADDHERRAAWLLEQARLATAANSDG